MKDGAAQGVGPGPQPPLFQLCGKAEIEPRPNLGCLEAGIVRMRQRVARCVRDRRQQYGPHTLTLVCKAGLADSKERSPRICVGNDVAQPVAAGQKRAKELFDKGSL